MTEQTNLGTNSISEQVMVNPVGSQNLEDILMEMADEINLGEDFDKRDYLYLIGIGLVIPFILMVWGWFL